jgi:protein SCO1/2
VVPARPARPLRRALAAILIELGSLAALLLAVGCAAPTPPLPRLGTLPAFQLVERSGRPLTSASLRGKVWVADFIFTTCGGACPAMTARMARLRREVPDEVVFVSFTVDPAHDTPEALSRYAASFKADDRWLFVTGPQKELYGLSTEGFKLAAMEVPPEEQKDGGDGPFLHSSKFVLVDRAGQIRGYYDSTDEDEVKSLVADLTLLQAERSS